MARLLVTADDFTGALDTGVQFTKLGLPTQVFIYDSMNWDAISAGTRVLVVDTESRHLPAAQAYKRVFQVCTDAQKTGVEYFYKKTDSTLRGNLGPELKALIDACSIQTLPFIPAYIEAGRTTKNGSQYVDGLPLHQTAFARDPLNPITDAYIPSIIGRQIAASVEVIKTDALQHLSKQMQNMKGILVFDALSQDDMTKIAFALAGTEGISAAAGCAGFAPYIPQLFGLHGNEKPAVTQYIEQAKVGLRPPILIVCGSVNEKSMMQIAYAEDGGIQSGLITPSGLFNEFSPGRGKLVKSAATSLANRGSYIIKTAAADQDIISLKDLGGEGAYKQITAGLASLVGSIMEKVNIGTLTVFGGDTAVGIVRYLGCSRILPRRELMPGIPLSYVESELFTGALVTKAGGFGDKSAVIDIIKYLEEGI
ncbi:MAG: four-carbon acid sugar kinase family protein [Firmicutes bacterium]|nr:four-carbon acid sugar kinase family protein [Bacillota bacterium]